MIYQIGMYQPAQRFAGRSVTLPAGVLYLTLNEDGWPVRSSVRTPFI